jgi:hypothetical protein
VQLCGQTLYHLQKQEKVNEWLEMHGDVLDRQIKALAMKEHTKNPGGVAWRLLEKQFDLEYEAEAAPRMAEILKYPAPLAYSTSNRRLRQWWALNNRATGMYAFGSITTKKKKEILAEYHRKFPNNRRALAVGERPIAEARMPLPRQH